MSDIEVGRDKDGGRYYAVWQPPVAIGSGRSMVEALRDMREAIELSVDSHVRRKLREKTKEV
ncbi:MAG: hypothetical protein JW753_06575 [Dehalococcoidia bacterium]|nr:hypothetical protein [Dehalococcoidia bacterium]